MKKIIICLLTVICVLNVAGCDEKDVNLENLELDGYTFDVVSNEAIITKCSLTGDITIPSELDGYTVVELSENLFYMNNDITSVYIPHTIKKIGVIAFADCKSLNSFEVDADNLNYVSIDGNLYSKDEKTLINYAIGKTDETFTVPNTVEIIGENAFSESSKLGTINLNNGLKIIKKYAFSNIMYINRVIIPNTVTTIEDFAFLGCSTLMVVSIPESVTTIGLRAFWGIDRPFIYTPLLSKPDGWNQYWQEGCNVLWGQTLEIN